MNKSRDSRLCGNWYAVIMAGGVGSRFWPVSTEKFPKQFHDMLGTGESLLQRTFSRMSKIVPDKNILVLTNERYENLVKEQLPKIADKRIVLEPAMRNTAPAILLAAMKIHAENHDALMLVAPSDHWIEDEAAFTKDIQTAFDACKTEDILMTIGIRPTFPNTGYGYIQYGDSGGSEIKPVQKFTEKPDYQTAKSFLEAGNYLWNAGIFIWSANSILSTFRKYLPEMCNLFEKGKPAFNLPSEKNFIAQNFSKAENISIDFGIMEKAENVKVLPASFDWNDLGTWGSLHGQLPKDNRQNAVVNAKPLLVNAQNNIIRTSKGKIVVVEGLDDYIIVENEKVLLIIPKEKEQDIKEIRENVLRKYGKNLG